MVFLCKVSCNFSVHTSFFCRRARSMPGVELKLAQVDLVLEPQVDALAKICRVGGKKLTKSSRCNGYPARDFAGQLQGCLGISVDDDQGVHPPSICTICHRLLRRYQAAVDAGRPYAYGGVGCGQPRQWIPHSRTCCRVCSQLEQDSVGGRPKKRKRRCLDAQHDNQEEDLEVERLVPPVDAQTVGHDQEEGASPHVDEAGTSVMSKAASSYLDEPEYTVPGRGMCPSPAFQDDLCTLVLRLPWPCLDSQQHHLSEELQRQTQLKRGLLTTLVVVALSIDYENGGISFATLDLKLDISRMQSRRSWL